MPSRADARVIVVSALALSSMLCLAVLAARMGMAGTPRRGFLVWNLFLAWIPLVVALVIYDRARRDAARLGQVALGAVWLVFFPNAPYLVTDFVHLRTTNDVPLWLDLLLFTSFAVTGLLLGLVSLLLVHTVLRGAIGAAKAWWCVAGTLGLAGFGIYLGRFLRWNSWDVVTNPGRLAADVADRLLDPTAHPRTFAVTVIVAMMLGAAYLVLYGISHLRPEPVGAGAADGRRR